MSNLEVAPAVVERGGLEQVAAVPVHELIPGHRAPLGDGTEVRRLLPVFGRRMVGAWCFFDHYGPDDIAAGPGMQVRPHPHTGLQTVSWLLEGTVHHRDSLGHEATIEPGQLALMTAGRGIAHSEQSPVPHPALLHGAQLWVALPDEARQREPAFEHHASLPTASLAGAELAVVLGEFDGLRSPGQVHSPLVGLDVVVHGPTTLSLEPDFEYAAVALSGQPELDRTMLPLGSLLYLGCGRRELRLAGSGRIMLLGGEPFAEQIVMWWNLIARNHDEIAQYRADWNDRGPQFEDVPGWQAQRLLAPPLPGGRLRPRN